ncbi:MAG TPA: hypothetical protein VF785_01595 [Gemmatimonadaceae bacterium]
MKPSAPMRAPLFDAPEFRVLRTLDRPRKIQDFLNRIPTNKERGRETCTSPLVTLRRNKAHCMEGALLAALALWMHGHRPLILDLKTTTADVDHLVALFRVDGYWGGITKTNHAVLRYREPIYRDVRELAASYFHEYFMNDGVKTLRRYSEPFDLRKWKGNWATAEDDLWDLERAIDRSPHRELISRKQIAGLRKADRIEIEAGKLTEW